jgi:hypothetical protein
MPKYRLLSSEELHEMEKEFVEYLIINGITADEWATLKETGPEKVEKIIELFSDVVFESILQKVQFLEYREKKSLKVFQCLPSSLVAVVMECRGEEDVDFTNPSFIQKASTIPPASLQVYSTSKPYHKNREMELFDMIQGGCIITDDKLFKTLCLSLS